MKKMAWLILGFPILIVACNNESKDSVERADSINEARIDTAMNNNRTTIDQGSADFLVNAANAGMAEVQLGTIAQQKATNPAVKNFASMMVMDHTAANDQVKSLASQKNVTLPTAVSEGNQKVLDDLNKKSGRDYDRAYMKRMVDDHQEAVNLFERAINDAKDPDVSGFADKTLMKLRAHLDSAKAVRDRIK